MSKTIIVKRGAGEYYWSPFEKKDEHIVIESKEGVISRKTIIVQREEEEDVRQD